MVVDKFDIFRASISPVKADPPLGIHPDAVLTATVSSQLLQPIPRWYPQIIDILRRMYQFKLAQRRSLHGSINTLDVPLEPDSLGVLVPERSDHTSTL